MKHFVRENAMRSRLVCVVVFCATASCAGTPSEKSFDLVWHTVNETHFDPTFGGVDWEAAYDRYKPLVVTSKSNAEFYARTNEMLFELDLSHLLVLPSEELKHALPVLTAEGTTGLDVRLIGGEAIVTSVTPGSSGARSGIRLGQAVKSIDGKDVTEIVRQADALQIPPFNSRNKMNRRISEILSHIYGPAATNVRLEFADAHDEIHVRTLKRERRGETQTVFEFLPPFHIEFEERRLGDDIGYIRFNHISDSVGEKFADALVSFKDTRGLIIDVRGTAGGFLRTVEKMARGLLAKESVFSFYRFRDRTVRNSLSPAPGAFEGPVVVLIDVTSMSAAELFAGCMQAIGRVTVVGGRTPGYMLGADWKRLPNGGALMHTILEPRTADGTVLEDRGVVPDIEIAIDRTVLLTGLDPQMEAAVRHILSN